MSDARSRAGGGVGRVVNSHGVVNKGSKSYNIAASDSIADLPYRVAREARLGEVYMFIGSI